MGWEIRHNGRRYLYRNRRVGGKAVKEYVAADDPFGFGLEQADELSRLLRREAKLRRITREAEAAYRARIDALLKMLDVANCELRGFADGILYAIGFHNHHRGEWRMMRSMIRDVCKQIEALKENSHAQLKPLINYNAPVNDTEAVEWFKKAREGDREAQGQVQKLIVSRNWVNWLGNISQAATNNLIYYAAAQDPVWEAGIIKQVEVLLNQLLGDDPTILERLLARRVVNGWIATHALELQLTVRPPQNPRSKEHLDRALSRAEKRMRQAIGELARVRRLKVPAVFSQLGAADKQIAAAPTRQPPTIGEPQS